MISNSTPWNDLAVLIFETSDGNRQIASQGSLRSIVKALTQVPFAALKGYTINLPDRHVAPFRYDVQEFTRLFFELA